MDGKSAMCLVLRSLFTSESAVCLHLSKLFVYICNFLFIFQLFVYFLLQNQAKYRLGYSKFLSCLPACLPLSQLFVYFFAWHHTGAKTNILSRKLLAITRN